MRYVCKNPPGGTKPLSAHRLLRLVNHSDNITRLNHSDNITHVNHSDNITFNCMMSMNVFAMLSWDSWNISSPHVSKWVTLVLKKSQRVKFCVHLIRYRNFMHVTEYHDFNNKFFQKVRCKLHGNTSYTFLHHISTMAVCTCTGMCEAFTLLTEIIYVQFKDIFDKWRGFPGAQTVLHS